MTVKPPSPAGSVNASASRTRLRARQRGEPAGGRLAGPLLPALGRPAPRCRGRRGTRPGSARRLGGPYTGELVDGDIHGDVLGAGRGERRPAPLVAGVGPQPLALWLRRHARHWCGRSRWPPPGRPRDGPARTASHATAPSWTGSAGAHHGIGHQCGGHLGYVRPGRHHHLLEPTVTHRHPHLGPTVLGPLGHREGKVVEQLVGQHHPLDRRLGQLGQAHRDGAHARGDDLLVICPATPAKAQLGGSTGRWSAWRARSGADRSTST